MAQLTSTLRRKQSTERVKEWGGNAVLQANDAAGPEMILVQPDDPFQSLFMPSYKPREERVEEQKPGHFSGMRIRIAAPSTRTEAMPAPAVEAFTAQETVAAPAPQSAKASVPTEVLSKAKKNAKDAWMACVMMGAFIVGGIYFSAQRFAQDDARISSLTAKIDELTTQLEGAQAAVLAKVGELKALYQQEADSKAARSRTHH